MRILRSLRLATITATLATAIALPATAAVPTTSLVEGTLTSTGGGPAADGNYQVTFNLYKDAQAAAPYWTEGPVAVSVKNGAFAWQLGSTVPVDVAALGQGAFLSLKVGTDPELARKPVSSSLYALRAAVATLPWRQAARSVQLAGVRLSLAQKPRDTRPRAGGAGDVLVLATGEHRDAHGLAGAVREHRRATDLLVGLRCINAQIDRHVDGLVELGHRKLLDEGECLIDVVGLAGQDLRGPGLHALLHSCHDQRSTSTPIERALPAIVRTAASRSAAKASSLSSSLFKPTIID